MYVMVYTYTRTHTRTYQYLHTHENSFCCTIVCGNRRRAGKLMYVHIYCMYIYIYMCVYLYWSTYIYIYISIHIFIYVHTYICMYIYKNIYICIECVKSRPMYIYIHVRKVDICIHIYTCQKQTNRHAYTNTKNSCIHICLITHMKSMGCLWLVGSFKI